MKLSGTTDDNEGRMILHAVLMCQHHAEFGFFFSSYCYFVFVFFFVFFFFFSPLLQHPSKIPLTLLTDGSNDLLHC